MRFEFHDLQPQEKKKIISPTGESVIITPDWGILFGEEDVDINQTEALKANDVGNFPPLAEDVYAYNSSSTDVLRVKLTFYSKGELE